MTNHERFEISFRKLTGQRFARSEIKAILQDSFPEMPDGSVLPDDHGRGNVNPCWCSGTDSQIFETLNDDSSAGKVYVVRDFAAGTARP